MAGNLGDEASVVSVSQNTKHEKSSEMKTDCKFDPSRKCCDVENVETLQSSSAPQEIAATFLRFFLRFSGDFLTMSAVKPVILHFAIRKRSDFVAIAIFFLGR